MTIQLKVLFTEGSAWLTENKIMELFVSKSENDEYKDEILNKVTTKYVLSCLDIVKSKNRNLRYINTKFFSLENHKYFLKNLERQKYYNLDIILAVGYHCDFRAATDFRKWVDKELQNTQVEPSFHRVYNLKLIILILSFVLPILAMTIILFTVKDARVPIISLSIALLVGVCTTAINIMIYDEEKGYKRTKSKG